MKKQKKNPKGPLQSILQQILVAGNKKEIRALFAFNAHDTDDEVVFKFNIWSRYFYPKFFHVSDAPFHATIDHSNLGVYRGGDKVFVDLAFRGAAKTTRLKLFAAFCIANDRDHFRRYWKVLASDYPNAKQNVTDVYNLLVHPRMLSYYPEIFAREGDLKRQETMATFTTTTKVKMEAGTVGMEQRGDIQEDARPDILWFDDFETRNILRSAVKLQTIWANMDEAYTGLSRNGGAIYNGNYLSERGNVHRLLEKYKDKTLIVPIKRDGLPTWPAAYTMTDITAIEKAAEDFAGDYMCEPSAGADIFFDRTCLDKQEKKTPAKTIADFKIFHFFDPSHRYGSGHDVAGGVGLDHSTSCFIDFTPMPNRVVGTFRSNTIKPDVFGDEIEREACIFGKPVVAPEINNHGHATIGRLKQIYDNIYFREEKATRVGTPPRVRHYGWQTNGMSKPKMLYELKKAVEDGHLELSDPDLIAELRSYTRDDLMDKEDDPRLTTRHFDLLIAAAIAWQMRNFAETTTPTQEYVQPPYEAASQYEATLEEQSRSGVHPLN